MVEFHSLKPFSIKVSSPKNEASTPKYYQFFGVDSGKKSPRHCNYVPLAIALEHQKLETHTGEDFRRKNRLSTLADL
jgi:hypothetical protein